MNAVLEQNGLPAVIGAAFAGGFNFGKVLVDTRPHLIVVAPKALGEHPDASWKGPRTGSYNDSFANTVAMAEAGNKQAIWAREQRINGFTDWCIPARDVLELLYRRGKPHARPNACWFRDGDNASSIPVGYPYTQDDPAQTTAEAFRTGGAEAFDEVPYWSSTPFEAYDAAAWAQGFDNGFQDYYHEYDEFRVRLVRLIEL